jgi:hypothetical protein
MTENITSHGTLVNSDTRRRVWAIVSASSGNLVEWFDFYVYSFCSLYFAHFLPIRQHNHTATANCGRFCRWVPDAPNWWLAVRPNCGSPWP